MAAVLSPTPVRILVVDDHLVVREGTALLVRHDPRPCAWSATPAPPPRR